MKRYSTLVLLLFAGITSFAQTRMPSKDNPSLMAYPISNSRTEIILPEVNGYKVLKADLHVHTIYSDGYVIPSYRISEAWRDGLDVIAITDHLEHRTTETRMIKYLSTKEETSPDLNFPVNDAVSKANHLGITLIPGAEITRDPNKVGHFNCLFTKDNNLLYAKDPLQSIRNAKKQGAIVQINHPGWRNPDNSFTPIAEAALKEGLVDGVEIINTEEFYPDVIQKALSCGLYMSSGTDIHNTTYDNHLRYGFYRNITLILAKDASLESVREALEAQRTLVYGFGDIAGSEELLKDFFRASVLVKTVYVGSKGDIYLRVTNTSSFPYTISFPNSSTPFVLDKLSSVDLRVGKGTETLPIQVGNMWFSETGHPTVVYQLSAEKNL